MFNIIINIFATKFIKYQLCIISLHDDEQPGTDHGKSVIYYCITW